MTCRPTTAPPVVMISVGAAPDVAVIRAAIGRATARATPLELILGRPAPASTFPHVPTEAEVTAEDEHARHELTAAIAAAQVATSEAPVPLVRHQVVGIGSVGGALAEVASRTGGVAEILVARPRRRGPARRAATRLHRRLVEIAPTPVTWLEAR